MTCKACDGFGVHGGCIRCGLYFSPERRRPAADLLAELDEIQVVDAPTKLALRTPTAATSRRPFDDDALRAIYGKRAAARLAAKALSWPWRGSLYYEEGGRIDKRPFAMLGGGALAFIAGLSTDSPALIVAGLAALVPYEIRAGFEIARDVVNTWRAYLDEEIILLARRDGNA